METVAAQNCGWTDEVGYDHLLAFRLATDGSLSLLQRLPEQEREVISLVDGPAGLTIEEAAGVMHLSRRSARHLRDKGLRKLEKWGEQRVLDPVFGPRFPTV